ncbi:MAG: hypothetical protein K8S13_14620 [Desulfobacula sp.]|uniref:hypothetical protein n=1 Tax=Desulfobacula sp. TaxID=2593537 RepID=UPI0025B84205|nr:hypothetical protein [Desulfobacula sp.]MCD4721071.1 hypothetical protein [Desulfobacula sp.]
MKLLIIKSGQDYIRFKDHNYLLVRLDKASVFPFDQMDVVQKHESRLKEQGFDNVCIRKLILTEEDI